MLGITKLTCPTCGGKIELEEDNDRVICLYCGNQLQVERKDGEIAIRPFVQAVKTMQGSMDRAASEMAINRIKSEIITLQDQREPYLEEWNRLETIHNKVPHFKTWTKIFLWSLPGSFILFIIGVAIDRMAIGILAVCLFFGAIIALIVNGKNAIARKKADKEYEKMSQFMIPLNEQIEKKNKELEKHQKIVEF
jgi:hypothetical protein